MVVSFIKMYDNVRHWGHKKELDDRECLFKWLFFQGVCEINDTICTFNLLIVVEKHCIIRVAFMPPFYDKVYSAPAPWWADPYLT